MYLTYGQWFCRLVFRKVIYDSKVLGRVRAYWARLLDLAPGLRVYDLVRLFVPRASLFLDPEWKRRALFMSLFSPCQMLNPEPPKKT